MADLNTRHIRPTWVTVLAIAAAIVIALVVVKALVGGDHGPGRHLPGGDAPAEHTPPPGGHD